MIFDVQLVKQFTHNQQTTFSLNASLTSNATAVAIIGASGSGKSIFLKTICGIYQAQAGRIAIANKLLYAKSAKINLSIQQRRVSYLFQNYTLFPYLTVAQNIAMAIKKSCFYPSKKQALNLAEPWLNKMGLTNIAQQYPAQISGGQSQRVALARALACRPLVLLLDEPFSALNPELRVQMRQEVLKILTDSKIPFIMATHDEHDIAAFSAQVWQMHNGQLQLLSSN